MGDVETAYGCGRPHGVRLGEGEADFVWVEQLPQIGFGCVVWAGWVAWRLGSSRCGDFGA